MIDRELYVGTSLIPVAGVSTGVEAVYQVSLSDGREPRVRCAGVEGQGWVAPIVIDNGDPRVLYAGTSRGGVFRSLDGARSWEECSRGLVYKEVWSLAQHPVTGDLYAGTQPAAIFQSRDRGDTWEELAYLRGMVDRRDWSFPGPPFIAHVKHIAFSLADPALIFAAIEEGWVIRSTDGGRTWLNIKLGTAFDAHSVTVMPDDHRVIMHTGGTGVYRSTDGGNTFVDVDAGLEQRYMTPVAVHPERPERLFTAASEVPPPFWRRPEGANAAFYRSDDQGQSWTKLDGNLPTHIDAAPRWVTVDPDQADTAYFSMSDGSLWLTDDSGESFQRYDLGGLPAITGVTVSAG